MYRNFGKHVFYLCDKCNISNQYIKRYAGHSKWQNIRHIKGQKDMERSLMFHRLGRLMRVAVAGKFDIASWFLLCLYLIFRRRIH